MSLINNQQEKYMKRRIFFKGKCPQKQIPMTSRNHMPLEPLAKSTKKELMNSYQKRIPSRFTNKSISSSNFQLATIYIQEILHHIWISSPIVDVHNLRSNTLNSSKMLNSLTHVTFFFQREVNILSAQLLIFPRRKKERKICSTIYG